MADQGGSAEARDALLGDGAAEASGRWRSGALLPGEEGNDGRTPLVCPDPSSRVFVFEINQVRACVVWRALCFFLPLRCTQICIHGSKYNTPYIPGTTYLIAARQAREYLRS